VHAVSLCGSAGAAIAGEAGSQLCLGISVKAVPPTASVPITSSTTWLERLSGSTGSATGRRLPNSCFGVRRHDQ